MRSRAGTPAQECSALGSEVISVQSAEDAAVSEALSTLWVISLVGLTLGLPGEIGRQLVHGETIALSFAPFVGKESRGYHFLPPVPGTCWAG